MTKHPRGHVRTDHGAGGAMPASDQDGMGMVSTLVAGPVVWGLVGAGADEVFGTERVLLAVGLVVGFVISFYIVFMRYGRS